MAIIVNDIVNPKCTIKFYMWVFACSQSTAYLARKRDIAKLPKGRTKIYLSDFKDLYDKIPLEYLRKYWL